MILSWCFYKNSTGPAYIFWLLHFLLNCKKFLPRGKNQFLVTLSFLIWEKTVIIIPSLCVFVILSLSLSLKHGNIVFKGQRAIIPPVSQASRKVANLLKEKIHITWFVAPKNLSVCLLQKIAILHIFMRSLVYKKLHKFRKFWHHLRVGLFLRHFYHVCRL